MFYRIKNGSPEFWIGVVALFVSYFSTDFRIVATVVMAFSFGIFIGVGSHTPEWLKAMWLVRMTLDKLQQLNYDRERAKRDAKELGREVSDEFTKAVTQTENQWFSMARDALVLEQVERFKVKGWPINSVLENNAHQARARLDATKKALGVEDE